MSTQLNCVLFADDTTLFCSNQNLGQLLDTVEAEMKTLKKWFDVNKLSLNIDKTKFILFSNKQINTKVQIRIDKFELELVNEIKFLGIIIDRKISWKSHITYIKSKISKTLAILSKTKHILDTKALNILYQSLIVPYMTYCVEIWGNTYKTIIKPIVILQKRAIRIINKTDYYHPTNKLFMNSNLLKFNDLVEFKIAKIMYKIINNKFPDCVQNLFQMKSTPYELRGTLMFSKPQIRTNVKQRCLSVQGLNCGIVSMMN